jgi:hypothetical protein
MSTYSNDFLHMVGLCAIMAHGFDVDMAEFILGEEI